MSFSNGNDSFLYIYFKQENAKKIYVAVLRLLFAQNTVSKITGGMPLRRA
jgi:hypothetical protein